MTTSRRVLIIDDERQVREQIEKALSALDVTCEFAETGEEGRKRAEDLRVGAVVLDVRLPDASGVEVLRQLHERRPELRVIVLSASTDQERVLDALRLGACDYLAKPLHEEELQLAVGRALEGHALEARWQSLRGRLHGLGARLAELSRLAAQGDAAALAPAVAETLAEVMAARRSSLLLADPTGETLRVAAAIGCDVEPDEIEAMKVDECVAGLAMARGQALLLDDVASDERCAGRARRGRYQTPAAALAALEDDAGPFGVLCAADRESGGRFEDEDLALLRILARQVAPWLAEPAVDLTAEAEAAEAAPPPAAIDGDVERAELAREICDAMTAEMEPERVLGASLRAVARALEAGPVSLHLADGISGELLLECECADLGPVDRPRLPRDRGLTGGVLQTGRLVATDAPQSDARFDPDVDTPSGGEALPLLCLPLRVRGKVLGVARVFLRPGASASAATGEVLAASLSAAVRNALLYRSLLESIDDLARARRESGGERST